MNAQYVTTAIEIANDLRSEFGEEQIKDLPKGDPLNPKTCILAQAFNFECTIRNNARGGWVAVFPLDRQAEAEALDKLLSVRFAWARREIRRRYEGLEVTLPPQIATIALSFDQGKLPRYIKGPFRRLKARLGIKPKKHSLA